MDRLRWYRRVLEIGFGNFRVIVWVLPGTQAGVLQTSCSVWGVFFKVDSDSLILENCHRLKRTKNALLEYCLDCRYHVKHLLSSFYHLTISCRLNNTQIMEVVVVFRPAVFPHIPTT